MIWVLVGGTALGLLGLVASRFSPLGLAMACTAIALVTAAREVVGFRLAPLSRGALGDP